MATKHDAAENTIYGPQRRSDCVVTVTYQFRVTTSADWSDGSTEIDADVLDARVAKMRAAPKFFRNITPRRTEP